MSNRDPAVEAAKRAWVVPRGRWALPYFDPDNRLESCYILAAREVLKPLRELHQSTVIETQDDRWLGCNECGQDWPCSTAELIYAEDEL